MIAQPRIEALLKKFPQLFREELGKMAKITARLTRKEDTSPVFMKARPVPYSLRHKVETELERMVEIGALTPVSWSEWASPIVVVPKSDGSVRICGDFRVTVNPSLKVDQYPLPRVEDILATLQDSTTFSKIDLQSAYLQMELEEGSKEVTTINTQKGLYRFNRLAFGIASASAIWQRAMDQVLMGIPKTQCLLDDIIVAGSSVEEHLTLLEQVLDRLAQYNLTLNKKKYNITQLRAFLGMVNYYHRFLPNLSHKLAPLHWLLQKGVKWEWTEDCTQVFQDVKLLMASETVLTHFKRALAVNLACDASPYGLGAVLSHVLLDGTEQPIAYASRTLSSAENYSQIDKEAWRWQRPLTPLFKADKMATKEEFSAENSDEAVGTGPLICDEGMKRKRTQDEEREREKEKLKEKEDMLEEQFKKLEGEMEKLKGEMEKLKGVMEKLKGKVLEREMEKEARGDECEEMSDIDEEEEDEDQEDVQEVDCQEWDFPSISCPGGLLLGPLDAPVPLPTAKKRTWGKLNEELKAREEELKREKEKLKGEKEKLEREKDELLKAGSNEAVTEKEKQLTQLLEQQVEVLKQQTLVVRAMLDGDDDAPTAKIMKLDGELSMLSVFTSTISCSVPAEKNDAIFVHIISVEIDFSAPPVFCAMNAKLVSNQIVSNSTYICIKSPATRDC
ncbi:hypothetical protein EMCRGX_G009841 [Ephydatia muelleri]